MAQIFVFPSFRHCRIVDFVAKGMCSQRSADDAEQYLTTHLDLEWSRLADLGVADTEIEQHCHAFARVAWRAFFQDREARGVA